MSQTAHPESDPLTELLTSFPLPIKFAGHLDLTAPWRLTVPQNVVLFGIVTGSKCWLSDSGKEKTVAIAPSDFIALAPACECQLSSGQEDSPIADEESVRRLEHASCTSLTCGGGGSQTGLIGGILEFNGHGSHPLFSALPPVLHLTRSCDESLSSLGLILCAIEREASSGQPGARAIVSHLAQVLLIQAARLYLTESRGATSDALQGLLHRDLSPALALIRSRPEAPWTVASLAERVNMSRSSFSAVFTKVLGVPPMQYLREHRMHTACRLLQDSTIGLKEVSSRVGYDSVSAFSTAFKRYSGLAPGDYRRQSPPPLSEGAIMGGKCQL
jgi:AraC-like DNA-binding protein